MRLGFRRARWAVAALAFVTAPAGATKADDSRALVSTRLNLGAGIGNFQLAGRAGWSTELWLGRTLGLGTHLGALAEVSIPRSSVAYLIGPELAWKPWESATGYWFGTLSSGYAFSRVETTRSCPGGACAEYTTTTRSHSAFGSLECGYVSQGRLFIGGVALRADLAGFPERDDTRAQFAATINLIGGIELR